MGDQTFPPLEAECGECSGSGEGPREGRYTPRCEGCKGTGRVPSAFGEAVLDFLERHAERVARDVAEHLRFR